MSNATRDQLEELLRELGALERKGKKKPLAEKPSERGVAPAREERPAEVAVAKKPEEWNFSFHWIPALLLFGFGDTLTSYLVFTAGGREANPVLSAMIQDGGMAGFVVLKTIILLALVATSYFFLPKRQGWVIPSILTLVGTFLVAYNVVTLFALI